ncbi:M20 family metallopeptidase [Aspergillus novofumigatus IBT 16806]|uniref:Carboxypeptidase S n=1 Tax=Aspergillus novofumigatus (strain IBT 16806) TaxID=1392255 RepID=A0A2I1CJG8_ASPN1|nr:carboxypeptidase S [Aspergillus novofumigatus IBT 16806]PKX97775.1 carboxypeptidase S [Aspergillus novofumigatus IBT 16806]
MWPGILQFTASIRPLQQILNSWNSNEGNQNNICLRAPSVQSPSDGLLPPDRFTRDQSIRVLQADRLSKAVQIPTTIEEHMNDPYSEEFRPFLDFQGLLRSLFPLTYSEARIDYVNRLGLVFTLNGTDHNLKPILFAAHQDVVPIDDPSGWTYPPFSGHFDGEWLWGRGASDCKNLVIGLLSVIEDLLAQEWHPIRTVILAFGFDEEIQGGLGAGSISSFLEQKYGQYSFEFISDEGGMGIENLANDEGHDDIVYALPGISEKGSMNMVLDLSVPGGHSSVPPPHTGIGIMSEIIYLLEREDLFTPLLGETHPSRRKLECQARYSPNYVEPWLADILQSTNYGFAAEKLALSRGPEFRFMLQTSQAADIFHGGVKANNLPENISALVNYRIAIHQSPDTVKSRAIQIVAPIARKYNLTLYDFREDPTHKGNNYLQLSTDKIELHPAPISPIRDTVGTRFAGVIRSAFESVPSLKGKTVVVVGDLMSGNTDTIFYWNLSKNIYRWDPVRRGRALNIHGVDERIALDAHLETMTFYYARDVG